MKKTFVLPLLSVFIYSHCFSQCFIGNFGSLGPLYKSTNDPVVNTRLNQSKADIEKLFKVTADLYVYVDQSPNAFANESDNPNYDGKVALGINLLINNLRDFNEHAIAGVLAHEYGHILQIKNHCKLTGKDRELHADFLAGFYFGDEGPLEQGAEKFAMELYNRGDKAFWNPDPHGTSEERVSMFNAGLQSSNLNIFQAYQKGIEIFKPSLENASKAWFDRSAFNTDIRKILAIKENTLSFNNWKLSKIETEYDSDFKTEYYRAKNIFGKSIKVPEMNLEPTGRENPKMTVTLAKETGKLVELVYDVRFCGEQQRSIGPEQAKAIFESILIEIRGNESLILGQEKTERKLRSVEFTDISKDIKFSLHYSTEYGNIFLKFEYYNQDY